MKPRAFICYKKEDDEHQRWVDKLAADLKDLGVHVESDSQLRLGDNLREFAIKGIGSSHYFLFISTPKARKVADLTDKGDGKTWLGYELDIAHAKARQAKSDFTEVCIVRKGSKVPLHFENHIRHDMRRDVVYEARLFQLATEILSGKPHRLAEVESLREDTRRIVLEHSFLGAHAKSAADFIGVYDPEPLAYAQALEPARLEYIAQQEMRRGMFENNWSYALHDIKVHRPQSEKGPRQHKFTLFFRPTDYYHFAFPNFVLDKPLVVEGRTATPREILGFPMDGPRLEDLDRYACHFRLGTGTVFISKDNKVVVGIRSRKEHVAPGSTDDPVYHLSVGEGMLRPVDEEHGQPSPFLTSIRGLDKELNLELGKHYSADDLVCIGILMDTGRAQPVFIFYVRSDKITFQELQAHWLHAEDRPENRDLLGLDWNTETAKLLIEGGLPYEGHLLSKTTSQTNQSRAGFLLAAQHDFGSLFGLHSWLTK